LRFNSHGIEQIRPRKTALRYNFHAEALNYYPIEGKLLISKKFIMSLVRGNDSHCGTSKPGSII
jgi:hypothetical protein